MNKQKVIPRSTVKLASDKRRKAMKTKKRSPKKSKSKKNINDAVRFRTQSTEESQQFLGHLLKQKGSRVPPRTLLANSQRELKYMRPTVAKLEATLRLLTKHEVDHVQVKGTSVANMVEVFDFNAELGNLINGAKESVHICEEVIRQLKASEEKRP